MGHAIRVPNSIGQTDLDVNTRTVRTPMSQVVTDLLEAMAGFEQMAGTGVSQPMWTIPLGGQAHNGKIAPHETIKGPR